MFVVPVSFGTSLGIVVLGLALLLAFGVIRGFFRVFERPLGRPTIADIRHRKGLPSPAPLTRAHKVFAWAMPVLMLAIILLVAHQGT